MTVKELAEKYSLEVICMPDSDKTVEGCYIGDLLSWVMGRAQQGNVWLTIMSNLNVAAVASLADVSCVLMTEGVKPDAAVIETATLKGVNILSTDKNTFETAVMIAGDI